MTNRKTSLERLALCGAALVSAAALRAETVLWYHFDEAPAGTRTTEDSRIRNAANPDALPGIPQPYNNGSLAENDADYYPVYSNAFPTGRRWVDPRTGETGTLNRCLHIDCARARWEMGEGLTEAGIGRIFGHEGRAEGKTVPRGEMGKSAADSGLLKLKWEILTIS